MPATMQRGLAAAAALLVCVSCGLSFGTQVSVEKTRLSAAGESCEALADCEQGLQCVDLVCRAAQTPPPAGGSGGAPGLPIRERSGLGESCARRADCGGGLPCIERVCRSTVAPAPIDGPRKGGRGESCVASNDCERGMGCVGSVCRDRDFVVSHVVPECHRVECVEDEDCCKDFRPESPMLCDELAQSCADGVQSDCNLHANLCQCSRACDDTVCVASVDCKNDLDCGGSGVLRCFAGKCAQCANDGDCSGASACVGGLCRGGCERNEECPIFYACEGHQCAHVGCQSDRDCFFESGSARSRCVNHECRTPCEDDSVCPLPFHGCVEGYCTFIGCEDDDQCRAALELQMLPPTDPGRAVCRTPEE
jgi:hypothetical protein